MPGRPGARFVSPSIVWCIRATLPVGAISPPTVFVFSFCVILQSSVPLFHLHPGSPPVTACGLPSFWSPREHVRRGEPKTVEIAAHRGPLVPLRVAVKEVRLVGAQRLVALHAVLQLQPARVALLRRVEQAHHLGGLVVTGG